MKSQWGRDFPHPSRPACGPPCLMYSGYWVSLQGARGWCWPPTTSSAKFKERLELYLYSSSGPLWPVLEWTLLYFYCMTRELKFESRLEGGCFTLPQHLDCVWGPPTPYQGFFLQKYTRWYIQLATSEVKNTWSSSCTSTYVFQVTSHLLSLLKNTLSFSSCFDPQYLRPGVCKCLLRYKLHKEGDENNYL
jgi:hypothetical protein